MGWLADHRVAERPDRAALRWVESYVGSVVDVRRLIGGWTSAMYLVCGSSRREYVLRLLDKDPWRRHGASLIRRESQVQTMLRHSCVPVPQSLGTDATGELAGHPAHLMSKLPGHLQLHRSDAAHLQALADTLARIHEFVPFAPPRAFQSWATPAKRTVPPWATHAAGWRSAFERVDDDPPFDAVFLHRDFHLGNVLWSEGQVSGVVDWVETSWGPAELDVAHCRTYLAMLHGPDAAVAFQRAYATRRPGYDPTNQAHWDVVDIVGYLPDPVKVVRPWRDHGIDISDDTARYRLEHHLRSVLA
jgi:aminoglycoside phosphotransferase (APT) family kinase protein